MGRQFAKKNEFTNFVFYKNYYIELEAEEKVLKLQKGNFKNSIKQVLREYCITNYKYINAAKEIGIENKGWRLRKDVIKILGSLYRYDDITLSIVERD